jgi:hypothetical protein
MFARRRYASAVVAALPAIRALPGGDAAAAAMAQQVRPGTEAASLLSAVVRCLAPEAEAAALAVLDCDPVLGAAGADPCLAFSLVVACG